jgi:hypothetical protein
MLSYRNDPLSGDLTFGGEKIVNRIPKVHCGGSFISGVMFP